MSTSVSAALQHAKAVLEDMYGVRLVHVILYGSQARGDAHAGSDVDILIILRDAFSVFSETKRLVHLCLELFDRYDVDVSIQPFSEDAYHNPDSAFMKTVVEDGIEL